MRAALFKKGEKSPGVQRQHCGAVDKHENCIVTVHLGYGDHAAKKSHDMSEDEAAELAHSIFAMFS